MSGRSQDALYSAQLQQQQGYYYPQYQIPVPSSTTYYGYPGASHLTTRLQDNNDDDDDDDDDDELRSRVPILPAEMLTRPLPLSQRSQLSEYLYDILSSSSSSSSSSNEDANDGHTNDNNINIITSSTSVVITPTATNDDGKSMVNEASVFNNNENESSIRSNDNNIQKIIPMDLINICMSYLWNEQLLITAQRKKLLFTYPIVAIQSSLRMGKVNDDDDNNDDDGKFPSKIISSTNSNSVISGSSSSGGVATPIKEKSITSEVDPNWSECNMTFPDVDRLSLVNDGINVYSLGITISFPHSFRSHLMGLLLLF
jgi:hypothetical protein